MTASGIYIVAKFDEAAHRADVIDRLAAYVGIVGLEPAARGIVVATNLPAGTGRNPALSRTFLNQVS